MTNDMKRRIVKSHALHYGVCTIAALTAVPLFLIVLKVLVAGIGGFSWAFFSESAPSVYKTLIGEEGGIAGGIIGTLLMLLTASAVSVPLGILAGTFMSEYKHKKFAAMVSFLTDLLQGTPSVVLGIVIYACIVVPTGGYSGFAGSIALGIMMLPLIIRSTEEALNIVPTTLREASVALGASFPTTVFHILLPNAFGGVFTGVLLAISRVIGETAPLMFTALGCASVRWDMTKPMSAVPLMIWEFWTDANLQELVWSAALFLLLLVLALNFLAKYIEKRFT